MNKRERSNEMRFNDIVFNEIVRYSRARGLDSIGILKMNDVVYTCLSSACDSHKGIINLESIGQIIRDASSAGKGKYDFIHLRTVKIK